VRTLEYLFSVCVCVCVFNYSYLDSYHVKAKNWRIQNSRARPLFFH